MREKDIHTDKTEHIELIEFWLWRDSGIYHGGTLIENTIMTTVNRIALNKT